MSSADIWTYRDQRWSAADLTGFDVEAVDGGIGSVDEATAETGGSYLVVDTGPWIFGTKDEIKAAPEFDEARLTDDAYRGELAGYYSGVRDRGPGGL